MSLSTAKKFALPLLLFIGVFYFSAFALADNTVLTTGVNTGGNQNDRGIGYKFSLTHDASINSVSTYLRQRGAATSTTLSIDIYSDGTNPKDGTLLASSTILGIDGTFTNRSASFPSSVSITAGTSYWLYIDDADNNFEYYTPSNFTLPEVSSVKKCSDSTCTSWVDNGTTIAYNWTLTGSSPYISLTSPVDGYTGNDFQSFSGLYNTATSTPAGYQDSIFIYVNYATSGNSLAFPAETFTLRSGQSGSWTAIKNATLEASTTYDVIAHGTIERLNLTTLATSSIDFATSSQQSFTITEITTAGTSYCSNIFSSASTTSELNTTCDSTSNVFTGSLCRMMLCLFVPSQTVLNNFQDLRTDLENKPPFGYVAAFNSVVNETALNNGTSSSSLGSGTTMSIFATLKTSLQYILWILLAFWEFNRLRHFDFHT